MVKRNDWQRWGYALWVVCIGVFAVLHARHLSADFPNGSPWILDWAKYTDEGWYGNGAVRAHLFGNWYVAGDFNPAVAVPVWPFVEWILFFFTEVTIEAARALAVSCFLVNLVLGYLLLRLRVPRWAALLGITLVAVSPFLYCFSRLAILEPLQTTITLLTLHLIVRLPRAKHPNIVAIIVGVLFALNMLTKTTGAFLGPAVVWAIAVANWPNVRAAVKQAIVTVASAAIVYGSWLALIATRGLMKDYRYYFFINNYPKPTERSWPLISLWWSSHGLLWADQAFMPLTIAVFVCAIITWRSAWARSLWRDPIFGFSLWSTLGYILFMAMQNHPQPRYYALPAVFCFFALALAIARLIEGGGWQRKVGWASTLAVSCVIALHGITTLGYAANPEYSYVEAAHRLTEYIDAHPNGNRLLVSISGDQLTLMTHLKSLCDDFGTEDLAPKLAQYQPGWYASWNDIDPATLSDLHVHYSLEQVATFKALDHPERNTLVLFKLHSLPGGQVRNPTKQDLTTILPDDQVTAPVE